MFNVQPESSFGDLLCEELGSATGGSRRWHTFEFAAAWANQLGIERIKNSARTFLAEGGCIRATVGLDFSSTSYEGLGSLLDLEDGRSDIMTHVFFDENQACTFHPKVFLFSNEDQARLFVGSNNMTGAGLGTNIEAALGITRPLDDETIQAALQAMAAWRDEGCESRTRRLMHQFLDELLRRGYVRTEQDIRSDRRKSGAGQKSSREEPLFGRSMTRKRKSTKREGGRESGGERISSAVSTEVLLMRVRPRRNGKQLQISMTVHKSPFMRSAKQVVSASDGSIRTIGYDYVKRGKDRVPNLARFEAPEMAGKTNPVARFQWVNDDSESAIGKSLQYEIFDAASSQGSRIFETLQKGITKPPVTTLATLSQKLTVLSKSNQEAAQWYRLDRI